MGKKKNIKLSPAQLQAVSTVDKTLCVSAGAGSGKTSVLVERFAYLVSEKGISPEKIAAITYTEKAANNMKERLVEVFTERGLLRERRDLENAYISTIHGFASRILKENPVEAGVDPHFTVIEAGRADLLMDQAIEEVFEEQAANPEIFHLLERYNGQGGLAAALKFVQAKSRSLGKQVPEILNAVERPKALELWRDLEDGFENYLKKFQPAGKETSTTLEKNREILEDLLTRIPRTADSLSWEEISTLEQKAEDLSARARDKEQIKLIKEKLENVLAFEKERAGESLKKNFLEIYELFAARFELRKAEKGYLDFEDLLLKVRNLFAAGDEIRNSVRERYRRQFEYIMVDEFQDTNRLQIQWIDRLARGNNLFMVGDAKQSIYRFRNAELEAFLEKKTKIAADPDGLLLELTDNYRSRPELLGFINALFEEFWKEDNFLPEKLVAKRQFPEKEIPSVEWLLIEQETGGDETDESMDKARIREARALAVRIKALVEDRLIQVTEKNGGTRGLQYGDIAILFRAMTGAAIYERELKEREIPYFALKERGFYSRLEIADLMNFLTILEHPNSDIPFAAVLRSPLAGLSEDALYWLSRVKEETFPKPPLCRAMEETHLWKPLAPEDREKWEDFIRLFRELAGSKDKHKISKLLLLILNRTHYDTKILGKENGRRKLANVRKLIDTARDFETMEAFGLAEFIRYVKNLKIQEARESEAQVELEKGESVKLLSIHKAKGLEFPVVILADLGRRREEDREDVNFTETYGLGMKIKNEKTLAPTETWAFLRNKELEAEKNAAEAKRLFYVAATRAQEHLILSGVTKKTDSTDLCGKKYTELSRWTDWLLKAFESCRKNSVFLFQGIPIQALEDREDPAPRTRKGTLLADQEPFRTGLEKGRLISSLELDRLSGKMFRGLTAEALQKAVAPFSKSYYEMRDLPVSAILKYEECPGCYSDVYEMGAPEERADEDLAEPDEDEISVARREFGNVFHRILERFDFENPPALEIQRQLEREKGFLKGADPEELERAVRCFVTGDWGTLMRKSEFSRELPFIYKLPRGQIRGQIDLTVKRLDGKWVILDYKTGCVASAAEMEEKSRRYELQILLYATAFRELTGELPAEAVLYFTALDQGKSFAITADLLNDVKRHAEKMLAAIALAKGRLEHGPSCKNRVYEFSGNLPENSL